MTTSSGIDEVYEGTGVLLAVLAFISAWIYAIATYGFFLGVGLGWIPAAVIAVIARFIGPLVLGAGVLLIGGVWLLDHLENPASAQRMAPLDRPALRANYAPGDSVFGAADVSRLHLEPLDSVAWEHRGTTGGAYFDDLAPPDQRRIRRNVQLLQNSAADSTTLHRYLGRYERLRVHPRAKMFIYPIGP